MGHKHKRQHKIAESAVVSYQKPDMNRLYCLRLVHGPYQNAVNEWNIRRGSSCIAEIDGLGIRKILNLPSLVFSPSAHFIRYVFHRHPSNSSCAADRNTPIAVARTIQMTCQPHGLFVEGLSCIPLTTNEAQQPKAAIHIV